MHIKDWNQKNFSQAVSREDFETILKTYFGNGYHFGENQVEEVFEDTESTNLLSEEENLDSGIHPFIWAFIVFLGLSIFSSVYGVIYYCIIGGSGPNVQPSNSPSDSNTAVETTESEDTSESNDVNTSGAFCTRVDISRPTSSIGEKTVPSSSNEDISIPGTCNVIFTISSPSSSENSVSTSNVGTSMLSNSSANTSMPFFFDMSNSKLSPSTVGTSMLSPSTVDSSILSASDWEKLVYSCNNLKSSKQFNTDLDRLKTSCGASRRLNFSEKNGSSKEEIEFEPSEMPTNKLNKDTKLNTSMSSPCNIGTSLLSNDRDALTSSSSDVKRLSFSNESTWKLYSYDMDEPIASNSFKIYSNNSEASMISLSEVDSLSTNNASSSISTSSRVNPPKHHAINMNKSVSSPLRIDSLKPYLNTLDKSVASSSGTVSSKLHSNNVDMLNEYLTGIYSPKLCANNAGRSMVVSPMIDSTKLYPMNVDRSIEFSSEIDSLELLSDNLDKSITFSSRSSISNMKLPDMKNSVSPPDNVNSFYLDTTDFVESESPYRDVYLGASSNPSSSNDIAEVENERLFCTESVKSMTPKQLEMFKDLSSVFDSTKLALPSVIQSSSLETNLKTPMSLESTAWKTPVTRPRKKITWLTPESYPVTENKRIPSENEMLVEKKEILKDP